MNLVAFLVQAKASPCGVALRCAPVDRPRALEALRTERLRHPGLFAELTIREGARDDELWLTKGERAK